MIKLKKTIQWPFVNLPEGTEVPKETLEEILDMDNLYDMACEVFDEWFDIVESNVEIEELDFNEFKVKINSALGFKHILNDELPKLVENYLEMYKNCNDGNTGTD